MSYSEVYAKAYCNGDISLIENYDKACSRNEHYELHHRLETHSLDGNKLDKQISRNELKSLGLLWHRPPEELIFLTRREHRVLHQTGNQHAKGKAIGNKYALGNVLSEITRAKMSKARLGNTNNGCAFIICVETGEINRTNEWAKRDHKNAYQVARGRQKTCNGRTFIYA